MIKWDLSQGCMDSSMQANESIWYSILTNWRIKTIRFLFILLQSVLISFFYMCCPVFPAPLIKEAIFAPLYILASFVKNKEHFQTPYTKINSKWIKDLNVTPETKTSRGEHRQNTRWHKLNQDPPGPPPRVTEIKTKVNKWDLTKL